MTNATVLIHHVELEDLPYILELQKSAYLSEAELYNDYTIAPLRQTLEEMVQDFRSHTMLKAQLGGAIVGSVRAIVRDGTCYIGRLIVSRDHQNQGIGQRLMRELEVRFAAKCRRFELFTGEKSDKNLYLYRKLGFRVYKEEQVSDKLKLFFMEKEPSPA